MPVNEVRIYHDPITQWKFEGSATVLKIDIVAEPTCFCKVRFLAGPEPRKVMRWVDCAQLRGIGLLADPADRRGAL